MYNELDNDPYGIKGPFTEFIDYKIGYWKSIIILLCLIVGFRLIALISFNLLVRKFQ